MLDEALAGHEKELQELRHHIKEQEECCQAVQEEKEQLFLKLKQAQSAANRLHDLSKDQVARLADLETQLILEREQNERLQAEFDAAHRVKRLARQQAEAMQLASARLQHRQIAGKA